MSGKTEFSGRREKAGDFLQDYRDAAEGGWKYAVLWLQLFGQKAGPDGMHLLKAVVAGFFVLVVGFFTAAVIAVSAGIIFIGRLLRGGSSSGREPVRAGGGGRARATSMRGGDVIDVTATEVPGSSSGS